MTTAISKTKLDNGLTVILKEMHHAPVISSWVWYRVGSRNEIPGITGSAHWVEHMMFKGTELFPPGTLDKAVSREGGRWNAFTWIDFTAYYETMPADRAELGLKIESDRMVNTLMEVDSAETERTVIISERHMNENSPMWLLREEMGAAAFRVHSYHHTIIGDETDLETMTRDDLYSFYKKHYAPNNAVVVVVGDFDSAEMLEKVKGYYGNIPAGDVQPFTARPEPPQRGERRLKIKGPGETPIISIGYKAPPAKSDDYYALALLNAVFTGGSSLGFFGSTTSNKSTRLYKSLVTTQKAVGMSGFLMPTIDPYLYSITALVHPESSLQVVEAAIDEAIAQLKSEPVTQAELNKAIKQAKVGLVMSSESITGQAQMIGMSEMVVGDYRWFDEVIPRLEKVTTADINRVLETYLVEDNRTVAWYLNS